MRRPTDSDRAAAAPAMAERDGSGAFEGAGTGDTGRRTHAIPVTELLPKVATPTAAGDDLASVPLPAACEVALEVTEGEDRSRTFRVERSRILIGRGDVDVPLSDRKISRRHASLEVYGASYVLLKDLGSTNGTFVNDRRVTSAELQDGDLIRLGETTVQVSICQTHGNARRRA